MFMISWKNPAKRTATTDSTTIGRKACSLRSRRRPLSPGQAACTRSATASAERCWRSPRPRWCEIATIDCEPDLPRDAGRLHRSRRADALHQREPGRLPRGHDVGARLSDARQMSGAFQLLRSNDLIWSRVVNDYLMGERSVPIDIMAWNADTTRMPYRMHSEYLRPLFLDNDLAEGRFKVDDRPIIDARYSRPDIRGRYRAGSRRALALGVQVPFLDGRRGRFRTDERRAQCGRACRSPVMQTGISGSVRNGMASNMSTPTAGWRRTRLVTAPGGRRGYPGWPSDRATRWCRLRSGDRAPASRRSGTRPVTTCS